MSQKTLGTVVCSVPPRPRILKRKNTGIVPNRLFHADQNTEACSKRLCFICNEPVDCQCKMILSTTTVHSEMRLSEKIGQLLGAAFKVTVHANDVICKGCLMKFNYLDRLEVDIKSVKLSIVDNLSKKYGFQSQDEFPEPPTKVAKTSVPATGSSIKVPLPQSLTVAQQQGTKLAFVSSTNNRNSAVHQDSPKSTVLLKPNEKIFKCLSCDYEALNMGEFRVHTAQCRLTNGLRCRVCKKIFHNQLSLMQHILYQHPSNYSCNLCQVKFTSVKDLAKHVEQCQLSCDKCLYKTPDKGALEEHIKAQHTQKGYMCSVCSMRFDTYEKTIAHTKTHRQKQSVVRFRCGKCHAVFDRREVLVKHVETHRNEQQVLQPSNRLPNQLGKSLVQKYAGNDAYFCQLCSLTFMHKGYYNQHMQQHITKGKENRPAVPRLTSNATRSALNELNKCQNVTKPASNIVVANLVDTSGFTFNVSIPSQALDESTAETCTPVDHDQQLLTNSSVARTQAAKGTVRLAETSTPVRSKGFLSFDAIRLKQFSRAANAESLPIVIQEMPAPKREPDMSILNEFLTLSQPSKGTSISECSSSTFAQIDCTKQQLQFPSSAAEVINSLGGTPATQNDNLSVTVQIGVPPVEETVANTSALVDARLSQLAQTSTTAAIFQNSATGLPDLVNTSSSEVSRLDQIDAELSEIFDDFPLFGTNDLNESDMNGSNIFDPQGGVAVECSTNDMQSNQSADFVEFDLSFLDSIEY